MKRLCIRRVLALSACLSSIACEANLMSDAEEVSVTSSALSSPVSVTAWPVTSANSTQVTWDGGAVGLLEADALAVCGRLYEQSPAYVDYDPPLSALVDKIQTQQCVPGNVRDAALGRWRQLRSNASCNTDRSQTTPQSRAVPLVQREDTARGHTVLDFAADNLCMAQYLRANTVGSSGSPLVLSATERQQLLEFIRERAQLAALAYARIGTVIATPASESANFGNFMTTGLQEWVANAANEGEIKKHGADFAHAIELHVDTTHDLLRQLGLNSSARLTTGTPGNSPSPWGLGSWRQRLQALLYGGDPFATTQPGTADAALFGWPSETELPAPIVSGTTPQVAALLSLARRFDAIDMKRLPNSTTTTCTGIDAPATGARIYRAVEAALRTQRCTQPQGTGCRVFSPEDPELQGSTSTFLVRSEYGVAEPHAETLARQLDELVGKRCANGALPGAMNFRGVLSDKPSMPGWEHMSADVEFGSRDPRQVNALYSRFAQFRLPRTFNPATHEWFQDVMTSPSERHVGVAAALAAIRGTIEANVAATMPAHIRTYFQRAPEILDLIGGAVGDRAIVIEPRITFDPQSGAVDWDKAADGKPLWNVEVTYPASDPWWSAPETYTINAFKDEGAGAALAVTGSTIGTTTVATAAAAGRDGSMAGALPIGADKIRRTFSVAVPVDDGKWTLVVRRSPPGLAAPSSFALLAGGVYFRGPSVDWGHRSQYLTFDGAFGKLARRLRESDAFAPALPAFDGFGLSLRRVPPMDPVILGLGEGGDPFQFYKTEARARGAEAAAKTEAAFETLIRELRGTAVTHAEAERSRLVERQASEALCGVGNGTCAPWTVPVNLPVPAEFKPTCPPTATTKKDHLACFALQLLNASETQVPLLPEINGALLTNGTPNFEAYGNGRLRTVLGEQWTAYQKLKESRRLLWIAWRAADAAVTEQDNLFAAQVALRDRICNFGGFSYTHGYDSDHKKDAFEQDVRFAEWRQRKDWCQHLDAQLTQEGIVGTSNRPFLDAGTRLAETGLQLHEAVGSVRLASSRGIELAGEAKLTIARQRLEQKLVEDGEVTRFGLYRQFHALDVQSALDAHERAREAALDLRRAIEGRYVVDLSEMTNWADAIYTMDLGVSGGSTTGTMIPSRVGDYVTQLEGFMRNYAQTFPSSSDTQPYVITLPGPLGTGVANRPNTLPRGAIDENSFKWTVACGTEQPPAWRPVPPTGAVAAACPSGQGASRARLTFTLSPLGRPTVAVKVDPDTARYNARWQRLAINLNGSGIIDCGRAADPADCERNKKVAYEMLHRGPALVTAYDGTWAILGLPTGRLASSRAIAVGDRWFGDDFGWEQPLVQSVAKTGFMHRPLGGVYDIEFAIEPQTQLENVDRVQVLVSETFWTRQGS